MISIEPGRVLGNFVYDELEIGQSASIERTLTDEDIKAFALVSGDVNPAHLDAEYAAGTMFKKVIAHGMWGGALISNVLGTTLPGPGTIYMKQELKFKAPVYIGDTVTATVKVAEKNDAKKRVTLACSVTNQDGVVVVEGEALVMPPKEKLSRPVADNLPSLTLG